MGRHTFDGVQWCLPKLTQLYLCMHSMSNNEDNYLDKMPRAEIRNHFEKLAIASLSRSVSKISLSFHSETLCTLSHKFSLLPLFSPCLVTASLLFISMLFSSLAMCCNWNCTIWVLLSFVYFTWLSCIFKVHPDWSLCRSFHYLFWLNNIPWFR